MNDINSLTMTGRLTKEPETITTTQGLLILNFCIATNRSRKEGDQWKEEVSYFDVSVYGKTAEYLKAKLAKGTPVVISGRLQQQRWVTNEGGNKSKVAILADMVQLFPKNEV